MVDPSFPNGDEASSNGRTADFGSAHEGSNPSASATPPGIGAGAGEPEEAAGAPERGLPRPERLILVAVGELPRGLLASVGAELSRRYGPQAAIGVPQQHPQYAFNKDRQQAHSAAILRRLEPLSRAAPLTLVVGVTPADLFVPDAPYVLGDADRDGRCAVVSTFRLAHGLGTGAEELERLKRRAQIEAAHQVGVLLGLSECTDLRCAMAPAHKPSEVDRKGGGLCASCRQALGWG